MEVWAMLPPSGASRDPVSAGTPPSQDPQGGYSRPAQARVGGHRSEIAVPFRSIIAPRPPHATGWCWWAVKVRARGRYRNQLISVASTFSNGHPCALRARSLLRVLGQASCGGRTSRSRVSHEFRISTTTRGGFLVYSFCGWFLGCDLNEEAWCRPSLC